MPRSSWHYVRERWVMSMRRSKEEYVERVKNNEKRTSELNAQRANFLSMIVSSTEKNERIGVIKKLYEDIKDRIENASYDVQTSLLRVFAKRIDLDFATNTADACFSFSSDMFLKDEHCGASTSH